MRLRARLATAALIVASLLLPTQLARSAASCAASSTSTYTVTICITMPETGATLTGAAPVTATAAVSGSGGVRRMIFWLDGGYLLTDVSTPYTFTLSTGRWVDGAHRLEAQALMRDDFLTAKTAVDVTFQNGVTTPPTNTRTFTPKTGTAPSGAFVVGAVGDGAGGRPEAAGVTSQIASWNPNLFLYLGDVYEKGSPTEFDNWYGSNDFFGRFRSVTNPTIGNHEYDNGVAPGYFDYWDNVPNYYSVDAGGWHFISLNSNSQFGQTAVGSPQYEWLAADLDAHASTACTAAFFHHPVYSTGPQGDTPRMQAMWSLMASKGVDIVLTGHDHSYQRFVPLDGNGNPSSTGITEFVVGGGGHGTQGFERTDSRVAVASQTYGALRMDLTPTGASYSLTDLSGVLKDSGSLTCSGAEVPPPPDPDPGPAPDTTAPSRPPAPTVTAVTGTSVSLAWPASTDDTGVDHYDVMRQQAGVIGSPSSTSFTDSGLSPRKTYRYRVRALDAAGNVSDWSQWTKVVTTA